MGPRITRRWRPVVEQYERRELLSAIQDVMAANGLSAHGSIKPATSQALPAAVSQASANGTFVPSTTSIALPQNQGPPPFGVNQALTPTGTLTPHEIRRERFVARYTGTYIIGPGRTSTQASQTFIAATGSANTMLHSDIQVRLITPTDPSTPISGISTIFDRNLNSNTTLGLDLLASQPGVDRQGRPTVIPSVTPDVNISSGTYVDSYGIGVMNIRYIPNGKRAPGVIQEGQAVVTIQAQIYSATTSFILHNAGIDP